MRQRMDKLPIVKSLVKSEVHSYKLLKWFAGIFRSRFKTVLIQDVLKCTAMCTAFRHFKRPQCLELSQWVKKNTELAYSYNSEMKQEIKWIICTCLNSYTWNYRVESFLGEFLCFAHLKNLQCKFPCVLQCNLWFWTNFFMLEVLLVTTCLNILTIFTYIVIHGI